MKPNVLIVDDNEQARTSFAAWLAALFPECVFLTADGGQRGLDVVAETQPAVVLMDIRMPGLDGFETIREMRRRGAAARVVILTSYDDPCYRREAEEAGAWAYVLKEQAPRTLPTAVRQALTGTKNGARS